jgi:transcriptional regulator with XRE-family HTH domain
MFKDGMNKRLELLIMTIRIKQKDFANSIGCSRSQVSAYIKGYYYPKPETLRLIERVYKVNLDWLYTGEGEMFLSPPAPPVVSDSMLSRGEGGVLGVLSSPALQETTERPAPPPQQQAVGDNPSPPPQQQAVGDNWRRLESEIAELKAKIARLEALVNDLTQSNLALQKNVVEAYKQLVEAQNQALKQKK